MLHWGWFLGAARVLCCPSACLPSVGLAHEPAPWDPGTLRGQLASPVLRRVDDHSAAMLGPALPGLPGTVAPKSLWRHQVSCSPVVVPSRLEAAFGLWKRRNFMPVSRGSSSSFRPRCGEETSKQDLSFLLAVPALCCLRSGPPSSQLTRTCCVLGG